MRQYFLGLFLILGIWGSAKADVVTLVNGHKVDCQSLSFKDNKAIIVHAEGKICVPRNLIARVESGSLAAIQSAILAGKP
jgi:hypothetical protein